MQELFEKYGVAKVPITKYCCKCCSSCGGYDGYIGVPSCKENVLIYPPITAEKVLALEEIVHKYLFKDEYFKPLVVYVRKYCEYVFEIFSFDGGYDCAKDNPCVRAIGKTRTEALSSLLINLYNHFTEEERAKVKEILER